MCGILCAFKLTSQSKQIVEFLSPRLRELLVNRGPDRCEIITNINEILFVGSVLWHQGDELASQPLQINGGILLFNGDIFNLDSNIKVSDSIWLLSKLNECKTDNDVLNVFKNIQGPYAFIYYNKENEWLYFGRDSFGRNSLIIENVSGVIRISSVSEIPTTSSIQAMELPSSGIFKIDLKTRKHLLFYPWKSLREEQKEILHKLERIFQTELVVLECINPDWLISSEKECEDFNFYDALNGIKNPDELFNELLKIESISSTVNKLLSLIENSVEKRVIATKGHCKDCLNDILKNDLKFHAASSVLRCPHGKIGILFSGGIDCTILAILCQKFIDISEPIDLINVAFQNISDKNDTVADINWNVPDRISARESYEELKSLFPKRLWNLVEININRKELYEKLSNHICHLIYPLNTVLDESIGCAFWFGAKGVGTVNGISYTSKSRVVLIGLGADELFGGYTRHRNSYVRTKGEHSDKLNSLKKELDLDWNRLGSRNLGRDDRVIADCGKTVRAPFIEENFVKYIRSLQSSQLCCFALDQGVGDKLLLRLCGFKLGLRKCTSLKKRAIQFGSKIADKKQNATDISKFLQQSIH